MRIAIMQPYFIPYAGYFRLFYAADLFVIFDCVQFPRRGFVHRNRLRNTNGVLDWLTLPLKKAPQNILIKDLEFDIDHHHTWVKRLRCFPQLEQKKDPLLDEIKLLNQMPLEFIIKTLQLTCDRLNLSCSIVRSSSLNLSSNLKAEDRIIEITKYFKATHYVNLANGRELYKSDSFSYHGITLEFLSIFQGSYDSILQRLLFEDEKQIREEIISQTILENGI